jgi:hypothetical protein
MAPRASSLHCCENLGLADVRYLILYIDYVHVFVHQFNRMYLLTFGCFAKSLKNARLTKYGVYRIYRTLHTVYTKQRKWRAALHLRWNPRENTCVQRAMRRSANATQCNYNQTACEQVRQAACKTICKRKHGPSCGEPQTSHNYHTTQLRASTLRQAACKTTCKRKYGHIRTYTFSSGTPTQLKLICSSGGAASKEMIQLTNSHRDKNRFEKSIQK